MKYSRKRRYAKKCKSLNKNHLHYYVMQNRCFLPTRRKIQNPESD